jgi:hypothetical protein
VKITGVGTSKFIKTHIYVLFKPFCLNRKFMETADDTVQRVYLAVRPVFGCLHLFNFWKLIRASLARKFYLYIYGSTALRCGPWPLVQFLNLYTVCRTPCTGDQPVARPLPIHRTTQTQNKRTQTSMHRVGFELTISVFERTKTVHASDRAATVTDARKFYEDI